MHTDIRIGVDSYFVSTSIEGVAGMSGPFSLGAAPYVTNGVTYVPLELFRPLLGNGADVITVDGGTISIHSDSAASDGVQIPSPFVDCVTMADAAKIAGFTFSIPAQMDGYTGPEIQAVKDDMIQAIFTNVKEQSLMLRKASGSEDVSGDYTEYAEVNTLTIGTLKVTTKGDNGKVCVAIWSDGGYSYAVETRDVPMSVSSIQQLVAQIH